jgi:hypothetical protein
LAILQRVALYPSERLDIPDARMIEAAAINDWRFFIQGVISSKSLVLSGFEITNFQNIFTVPGVRLQLNNVVLLHPEATTQAAGFFVSSGTEADFNLVLNPATTNFVEVDLTNVPGTRDVRAFWDSGSQSEFTDTVDTVINLDLRILTNVSGFTPGRIPLYKVITNSANVVLKVTDCRPLFFRLGTGGSSPDPDFEFQFPNLPDADHARLETPVEATSATNGNAPFQGGDKNIKSLKQWMDAVMSLLKATNGVPYWYMKPNTSLPSAYQNAALCLITGGTWEHIGKSAKVVSSTATTVTVGADTAFEPGPSSFKIDGNAFTYTSYSSSTKKFSGVSPNPTSVATAGKIVIQGVIGHLKLTGGSVLVRFGQANSVLNPFADIDLTTHRTLYVILSKDASPISYGMGSDGSTPVVPKDVTSADISSITVATGGNYIAGSGKLMIRGSEFSYAAYNQATGLFTGVSPDPSGLVEAGDTVYQCANGGLGFYHVSSSERVPGIQGGVSEGAERVFWLAYYDSANTIFIRDSELVPGESADVGSDDSAQIFQYIGSNGPSDNYPVYGVTSIADGTNLTEAISEAFQIIETPIYDEIIEAPSGFPATTILTLPPNTNVPGNPPGQYTMGTRELEIYENGILLRNNFDYSEVSATSVQLLRDVYAGTYLRFRIASVGGAGAAAGGSSGLSLQNAYANGQSILTTPGNPVTIDGPSGEKLLWVKGDVRIDGVLDPTGVELTPQTSNPIPTGKVGFWVNGSNHELMFTREDGSILQAGAILENLGGNSASLSIDMTNNTGSSIPAGAPVYISGSSQIALADADSDLAHRFFGITAQAIPSGSSGKVIYQGVVPGILAGSGIPSGEYIWLQTTPGGMAPVEPSSQGAFLIIIGISNGDDLILQQQTNGRVGV